MPINLSLPPHEEDYLNSLIAKAAPAWSNVDSQQWLDDIRESPSSDPIYQPTCDPIASPSLKQE